MNLNSAASASDGSAAARDGLAGCAVVLLQVFNEFQNDPVPEKRLRVLMNAYCRCVFGSPSAKSLSSGSWKDQKLTSQLTFSLSPLVFCLSPC